MNLTHCAVCNAPINRQANLRLRRYCSKECRDKAQSIKRIASGYARDIQRKYKAEQARSPHPDKKKCAICGLWYKRVAHHVAQRHQMTAYEYKQSLGVRVSRGIMTEADRAHMRALALAHRMDKQLERVGKKTRFVPGGSKQKMKKPNAGKRWSEDEYS